MYLSAKLVPFFSMSAEKFKVSNSLQSILGLIMLNEGNYLSLSTAPRCVASIWVFLSTSFHAVNSATVQGTCGALVHKTSPGEPKQAFFFFFFYCDTSHNTCSEEAEWP